MRSALFSAALCALTCYAPGTGKPVKILLQSHGFPPHGRGGTETYTADLARALAARGHAVDVLATRKEISRADLSWVVREEHGYRVHELINNLFHRDWSETWSHARIEALYAAKLEQLAPERVHIQHLLHWSAGCVELAARHAPVYFTLHDYWLRCPRFGQRRRPDGQLCETIEPAQCGRCLIGFPFAQSDLQRRVGKTLAGLRSGTGLDLGPLARKLAPRPSPAVGSEATQPAPDPELVSMVTTREQSLRERTVPFVRRFLAPSRFLKARFESEWKLAADHCRLLPFGLDIPPQARALRRLGTRVRIGFLGARIEAKGVHVLLEAWGGIDKELRERGELCIFGPADHEPAYQQHLEPLAARVGAQLCGRVEREQLFETLGGLDLLVVPSLWWENAPLVLLEARAARLPVLASACGALPEWIEEGRAGWLFPTGDVQALSAQLACFLRDPAQLESARTRIVAPESRTSHLEALEALYAEG